MVLPPKVRLRFLSRLPSNKTTKAAVTTVTAALLFEYSAFVSTNRNCFGDRKPHSDYPYRGSPYFTNLPPHSHMRMQNCPSTKFALLRVHAPECGRLSHLPLRIRDANSIGLTSWNPGKPRPLFPRSALLLVRCRKRRRDGQSETQREDRTCFAQTTALYGIHKVLFVCICTKRKRQIASDWIRSTVFACYTTSFGE